MSTPVDVFISYAAADDAFCRQLESHLSPLTQRNLISTWHPRKIVPGEDYNSIISEKLEGAHLILLLLSPDFLASSYLYGTELKRALERNSAGTAKVVPIIIRPFDISPTPFKGLSKLPANGEAVTKWSNNDAAWADIVRAIRHLLEHAGAIPVQSVVGTRPAATPIPGLTAASSFQPPQYPYGPASTGPRSGIGPQHDPGSRWDRTSPLQGPAYYPPQVPHQAGPVPRSSAENASLPPKALLGMLLAGAALLMLITVILSSALGSSDGGSCRAPVPETRKIDPPSGHTSGALRSAPAITSTQIDDVARGTFVTVMSAGRGSDQECWYRVRVKGSERTGWMHSVNIP